MINGLPRESLVLNKVAKPKRVVSAFHQTSLPSSIVKQNNTDLFVRGDENCVVCTCGQPAMLLTVKKDGPNQGELRSLLFSCVMF